VQTALETGGIEAAATCLPRQAELVRAGVEEALAGLIAALPLLAAAPDLVLAAERSGRPVADVTATYFAAEAFLKVDQIVQAARTIPVADYFERLALDRILDAIGDAERRLTALMLRDGKSGPAAVEAWAAAHAGEVERARAALREIVGSGLTLAKLAVAASLLVDLARG
jgi:glutamate dehydrogenase